MIGKQLRDARRYLNLTQGELGRQLGIHLNTIARMERDELAIAKVVELAVKFLTSKKQRGTR
jgi:transcriptional regulator with XRE-family HTH domain